jgi:hypothetical protein
MLFVTLRGMRKFLFSFWLALALPAAGAEIKIDFGDAATSLMPTNFHAARAGGGRPGEWKIIMDEVPPLLAPLSPQAPGSRAAPWSRKPAPTRQTSGFRC